MWRFLAVLRTFFHSSLLYTLSFHPFPPTSLPSSLTYSCHLFLGLPLSLVVSKFIYNTFLGNSISFQTSVIYLTLLPLLKWFSEPLHKFLYWLIFSNFLFHYHILGLKFFFKLSFQKCLFAFYLSLLVSRFLMHMLKCCLWLCTLVLF